MADNSAVRNYVEELTLVLEQTGLPRTASRVLAYLLVCKPAEQSMPDLIDALQMSKSSISVATQTLFQFKLISRVSIPNERRDYYRVEDGIWGKVMHARADGMTNLRNIAEKGVNLVENSDNTDPERLLEMLEFYTFLAAEMSMMMERWEAMQTARLEADPIK